ncbi:MAG: ribonuclease Z [Nitrospirae bacterium]|nr:ribonuclease Z [Nitrospirota bacterium]
MKPSFHARLINEPFDDPGLYIRLLREGRAFLFDSGAATSLSAGDILKISGIFISHTHVDHFIGFDNILRLHLRKEGPLRLYGPDGFINRVEGKLRGYTWNLIGDYPLVIEAAEINEKTVTKAVFRAQNYFRREELPSMPFEGVLIENSFLKIKAAVLDHQIPCLGFCLEENYHININKAKLNELDLPVGPWLSDFKKAVRDGDYESRFKIKEKTFAFSELKGIADITKGQKLSYVVDALGSEENTRKIIELVRGSDVLYIEAYFLDKDRERAMERYHLTAKQAGRIAREAGVGKVVPLHFSPKYMDNPEDVLREVEDEFR